MNRDDIASHYCNLSKHYNDVVYSSNTDADYQNHVTNLIIHYLDLNTNSTVVDLGAGVCTMASNVGKFADLANPVLCVDPSMEMLQVGNGLEGVQTLHMSAENWANNNEEECFDRIYIRGAIHHFTRDKLQDTLEGIYRKLKFGGRFLVEKPADTFDCLPYPHRVVELMNKMELSRVDTVDLLKKTGFSLIESHRHEFAVEKDKNELFESFRKRLCSGFSMFNDDEIEKGIVEVNEKFPSDIVKFVDERDFIVGCKVVL